MTLLRVRCYVMVAMCVFCGMGAWFSYKVDAGYFMVGSLCLLCGLFGAHAGRDGQLMDDPMPLYERVLEYQENDPDAKKR